MSESLVGPRPVTYILDGETQDVMRIGDTVSLADGRPVLMLTETGARKLAADLLEAVDG